MPTNLTPPTPLSTERSAHPLIPVLPPLRPNTGGAAAAERLFGLDEVGGDFVLYVSIPFCRVRCHACPFFIELLSENDPRAREARYVEALVADIQRWGRRRRWQTGRLRAVYIGGGTGSVLTTANLERVVDAITTSFPLAEGCELTLEGNARDFTEDKVEYVAGSPINRVSLGVQSFHEDVLRVIGSPHAAEQSARVINRLNRLGHTNIQLDMMYNLPSHTREVWQSDLRRLAELEVQHFTIYEYRVHHGSPQHNFIKRGKVPAPLPSGAEQVRAMYDDVVEAARKSGFDMYMIDYFARPGYESRYNTWMYQKDDVDVLAIGPGAYGYVNRRRYLAHRDVEGYIATVGRGEHAVDSVADELTGQERRERYVVGRLMFHSIDLADYRRSFGTSFVDDFGVLAGQVVDAGLATLDERELRLTESGVGWHRHRIAYGRVAPGVSRVTTSS